MRSAGIADAQASPKGLRHGFEVAAVQADVPLNLVQRMAGPGGSGHHSDLRGCCRHRGAGAGGQDVGF